MINMRKLKIYADYKGDLDLWIRTRRENEKDLIETEDWYLIDDLLEDAIVIQRDAGSEQSKAEAVKRLKESCEDSETLEYLKKLAKRLHEK